MSTKCSLPASYIPPADRCHDDEIMLSVVWMLSLYVQHRKRHKSTYTYKNMFWWATSVPFLWFNGGSLHLFASVSNVKYGNECKTRFRGRLEFRRVFLSLQLPRAGRLLMEDSGGKKLKKLLPGKAEPSQTLDLWHLESSSMYLTHECRWLVLVHTSLSFVQLIVSTPNVMLQNAHRKSIIDHPVLHFYLHYITCVILLNHIGLWPC